MERSTPEVFELSLLGGATERRYRALRPEIERYPWEALKPASLATQVRSSARKAWTQAALQEYASADAHAVMLRALIRARAPLDLSAVASRFALDELAHAELCARVAMQLGGAAPVKYEPQKLYSERRAGRFPAALEAADIVLWNCCVSESWSHGVLTELWHAEKDELLKPVRGRITKDEAVHARFGWIYFDNVEETLTEEDRSWLAKSAARAIGSIERGIELASQLPEPNFDSSCPLGGLGKSGYVELARHALDERVRVPLAERGLF